LCGAGAAHLQCNFIYEKFPKAEKPSPAPETGALTNSGLVIPSSFVIRISSFAPPRHHEFGFETPQMTDAPKN
jgi:hypothetical protein